MKHFKKMMALVIALVMVCGIMSTMSFVAVEAATSDASITISGLDAGDQVQFYQVLKWDEDAGWVLTDKFAALTSDTTTFPTNLDPGYTPAQRMEEVVGLIADGISGEEAKAIAAAAKGKTADATENVTGTSVTYTTDTVAKAGLYMAVIGASDPEVSYLPVFASADFKADNSTNAIDASKAKYDPDSSEAIAKKSRNSVEKTTKDAQSSIDTAIDSKVGEEVEFFVDTVIPVYFDCYDPSYEIEDVLTSGIQLLPNTIEVSLDGTVVSDSSKFTVTPTGTESYKVVFEKNYLLSNKAPVKVHIAYKGKITNAATFNTNWDDNTVTVTYNNTPTGTPAALRDKTNHYTFSIGADAFGGEVPRGSTYELIKVAADKDGKPIFSETNVKTWEGDITRHPLAGATFKLYTEYTSETDNTPYINDLYPSGATFTTDDTGVITFKGLEAGTYYLVETDAPDGFVRNTTPVRIEISAEYKEVDVPAKTEGGVRYAAYSVKVLDSYTVTVNGVATYDGSAYTYTSDAIINTYKFDSSETKIINMSRTFTGYADSDIINTPGVELPSTGGVGTTIFYIIGAILVLGAGILLITRRRAGDM